MVHSKIICDFFKNNYGKNPIVNEEVIQIEWPDENTVASYPDTDIGKLEYYIKYATRVFPISF